MNAVSLDFTISSGEEMLARFTLGPGEYVIGRSESSEIVVDLDGVSDRHARLILSNEGGWIEDLQSEQGTRLEGEPVKARAAIRRGQTVEFGQGVLLQIAPTPAPAPAPTISRRRKAKKSTAKTTRVAAPSAPERSIEPSPSTDEVQELRARVEAMEAQHHAEIASLKAARSSAENELRIVRDGLIVKQAAAARHLHELEAAHSARVQALEEELRVAPPPSPPAPSIVEVQPEPRPVPLTVIPPPPPPEFQPLVKVHRTEHDIATLVGLLHAREAQLREIRDSLRRSEDACEKLHREIVVARASEGKVQRWRKISAIASMVVLAALVGIAGLAASLDAERRQSERALAIVGRIKKSAPRFANEALELIKSGELEQALAKTAAAIALDSESAQLRILEGNILQSMLRIEPATTAYREALALDPKQSLAAANLVLCERILAARKGAQSPESLYALHRAMMEQKRLAEALQIARRMPADRQLLHQTWVAILDEAGIHGRLDLNEEGTFDLDVSGPGDPDLSVLHGMPLRSLILAGTGLADLSPVRGLPLRRLDLSSTRVRDLSPLEGMSLERLNLADTAVGNLFALRGMPLRELILDHAPLSNISELQGMPLETLRLTGTRVWNTRPLAGLPLRVLDLSHSRIAEITALEHLPIEWLDLEDTAVSDVRPLAGSTLITLNLSRTAVSDVTPLAKLPLRELKLAGCSGLRTVKPLAGCTELERLVIPRQAGDVPSLKQLPRLRFLSFEHEESEARQDETAHDFWTAFREH